MDVVRRTARRPSLAWLAGLVCAATLAGFAAAPAFASTSPVGAAGWTTVWRDDFTGPAGTAPAAAGWLVDTGHGYPGGATNWGTGEIESATGNPANLSLDGRGDLALTARRTAGGWTSARIETRRADFAPPPGGSVRFEARLALPNGSSPERSGSSLPDGSSPERSGSSPPAGGQGLWPAFWALGAPFRPSHTVWPGAGEIDVMEQINGQAKVHGTLHCGTVEQGGPCHEDTGLTGAYRLAGTSGFHTYTMVWTTAPDRLQWLVDGQAYWTVSSTSVGATTWAASLGHGFFLVLDLAVGGYWPGMPTSATRSGAAMLVDYVSVAVRGAP